MAVRLQLTSIQMMFLLLCTVLLATILQGVQGEADVEGPSESECRPYIEKALKKLETGDAQSAEIQDDIAHIVTTDDSEIQGDSLEITDAETSKSAEDETQEDDGKSVEEETGQSIEEQDASAETGDTQEDSVEEKDVENNGADGATEEVDDDSAEKVQDEASAEKDTQHDETSVEEATAEQVSVEDSTASKEEVDEGSVEQNGSVEQLASVEEGTEEPQSVEQDASVEQGSQEQADEPKSEESVEQVADESADQAEGSVEQKEESAEQKEGSEEEKKASGESKEESGEHKEESAEQQEESAEQKEESEEQKVESGEQKEESEEQKEKSTEQTEESGEQKEESGEQKDESAEQTAESAEQAEGSVESGEQTEESGEQKESEEQKEESTEKVESEEQDASTEKQESTEQIEASVEQEASTEGTEENESAETKKSGEQATEDAESAEKSESKEQAESAEGKVTEETASAEAEIEKESDEAASTEEIAAAESESTPEEDLTWEIEIPTDLRPRDHVTEILHLNDETSEVDNLLLKASDNTLKELKRIYENAIQPLETVYKYRDLSNRHFGDPEIFSKPLVLFMGPWSGGKSSIINYLLDNEYTQNSLRTGAEPSPAYFNLLMWGEEPAVLDGTQLAADWTFSGLQKFGQGLEERLRGLKLPNKLLEKINIAEIPGILEVRKQVSRVFPFNDACQWFIDRADIIFLVYDPSKLDVGPETEAILDQLKGREYQTRIILNKADQVKPEELMRVQGALIWNISPLMSSAQPPVMYSTSLWSKPYEIGAPIRLLHAQERAFLRDLKTAIDKRIENKISSARRFAVRVRNHAKMVDCYLTTYYNHKSVFGNKKLVADQIIEHPQDYHIYEGLSTLTNISRYDLPDPDVYRDFFRLNPLYDFQQLSATCTYFRGCPINRLDIAIAYDLPELVGKYKKTVETIQAGAASNTDSSTKS